ncbi:hypothetical protein D3C81_1541300 [compost metagenome]
MLEAVLSPFWTVLLVIEEDTSPIFLKSSHFHKIREVISAILAVPTLVRRMIIVNQNRKSGSAGRIPALPLFDWLEVNYCFIRLLL